MFYLFMFSKLNLDNNFICFIQRDFSIAVPHFQKIASQNGSWAVGCTKIPKSFQNLMVSWYILYWWKKTPCTCCWESDKYKIVTLCKILTNEWISQSDKHGKKSMKLVNNWARWVQIVWDGMKMRDVLEQICIYFDQSKSPLVFFYQTRCPSLC